MKLFDRFILSLLPLIAAACSSDPADGGAGMPVPGVPEGPVELSMAISLGGSDGSGNAYSGFSESRATPTDGDYDPGTGYENYIDIDGGDFALYIFGLDNKLVARAGITSLVPDGSALSSKTYTCRFRVDAPEKIFDSATGLSFKLVMLANWHAWNLSSGSWADYPDLLPGASVDDLYAAAASTRSCPDGTGPAITADTRIPLFGINSYIGISLANDVTNLSETLHLLRAFAKIEVFDGAATEYQLTGVTLTRSNALFKCMPSGVYDRGDYVKGSHATDYVGHVSIPEGTAVSQNLPLFKDSAGNGGKGSWIIYVPEYDNTSASAVPSQLSVTFSDGHTSLVDFKNYGDLTGIEKGKPFDLRRNNWYIYTLTRRHHYITVEVDVQPYAEVRAEANLGLMADDVGDLMVYKVDDPDNPGQLMLPKTFSDFLTEYGKSIAGLPEYRHEMGDYYAIHRLSDGTMKGSEVWLKDRDACRVLEEFSDHAGCGNTDCFVRKVQEYDVSGTAAGQVYKNRDGQIRRQHNGDHSTLIYDTERGLLYKTSDKKKLYEVESWNESTGDFYVHVGDTDTDYVFREFNKAGEQTGKVIHVNKTTGDSTTLTGQDKIEL